MQRHRLSKILEGSPRRSVQCDACGYSTQWMCECRNLHISRIDPRREAPVSSCQRTQYDSELVFVDITGGGMDPVSLVCSQNRFRRQLSVSQRAQIAVELSRWVDHGGDRRSEDFKRSNDHLTTKAMAANAEVSEKSIRRAKNRQT